MQRSEIEATWDIFRFSFLVDLVIDIVSSPTVLYFFIQA